MQRVLVFLLAQPKYCWIAVSGREKNITKREVHLPAVYAIGWVCTDFFAILTIAVAYTGNIASVRRIGGILFLLIAGIGVLLVVYHNDRIMCDDNAFFSCSTFGNMNPYRFHEII